MPGKNGYQGKTATEIETTLKLAWDAWIKPTCTNFSHSYLGQTSSPASYSDRKLVVFLASTTDWANMRLPSSVLAVTQPVADNQGRLLDADISFNPQPSGRLWGMHPAVTANEMDFADVAAHEIGHALGFGHTAPRTSLMYFSVRGVGPLFSGLTSDEEGGICAIYPTQTCTTDAACGTCRSCVNGSCGPKTLSVAPSVCKGCTSDASCGGGACTSLGGRSRCLQACDPQGCCPNGFSCKSLSGRMLCSPDSQTCPDLSCSTPAECGANETCSGGKCQKTCSRDSDCEAGFSCQNQSCLPAQPAKFGQPCSSNVPCASGGTCEATSQGQICTLACGTGTGGFSSSSPGSACVSCPSGTQCLSVAGSQACVYPCSSTSSCGTLGGGLCGQVNGSPLFCFCRYDADCKTGFGCNKSVFGRFGLGACAQRGGTSCPNGYQCDGNFCLPSATSTCGNGLCDGSETCATCPLDCPCTGGKLCQHGSCSLPSTCGNGSCDPGETCDSCAQDCPCSATQICTAGRCEENKPVCGNGICDGDENCDRCKADCLCPQGLACKAGLCSPLDACGDGICASGEACDSCPQDCSCKAGQICLDSLCQAISPETPSPNESSPSDASTTNDLPPSENSPDPSPGSDSSSQDSTPGRSGGPCKAKDLCDDGSVCVRNPDGSKICLQANDPLWKVRASGCSCHSSWPSLPLLPLLLFGFLPFRRRPSL